MENKRINVGFVSYYAPDDRKSSSGTNYQLFQALSRQKELNVYWVPFKNNFFMKIVNKVYRLINKVVPHLMPADCSLFLTRMSVNGLDKSLVKKTDVLFSPYARLYKADKPVVYHSDALYHQMMGYYWNIPLNSREARIGDKLQRMVVDNAKLLVFPSQWAADDAVEYYGQPTQKIRILKYGPNIDKSDIIPHKFHYDNHLHILFLGVDWVRKGGQLAVDTVKWLNEHGVKSTLHIVGIRTLSNDIVDLPHVDYVGFLNKNIPNEYKRLSEIISMCHCMLLPTKAECAGIAFCESSANGLPSFTHRTGGIPEYVVDGVNGYTLPLGSTAADFGTKIKECLLSGEMEKMSRSAVEYQQRELNYDVFGEKMVEIFREVIQNYRE